MNNINDKCEHIFLYGVNKRKRVNGRLRPLGTCYNGCLKIPITSKYEKMVVQLTIDNSLRDTYRIPGIKNRPL